MAEKSFPGRKTQGVPMAIEMDDEMFRVLTDYCCRSDNAADDTRRAEMLGLGGRGVQVAPGAIIRVPKEQIGKNVFIGLYCYLNGNVTVGDNTLIGPHCSLSAGNHKFDPGTGWFSARTEPDGDDSIVVGAGSWLASNVTVTGGVKLGKANLVCAGAVVTKSSPDYAILAGIPAKPVGRIDPETGVYHWFRKEGRDGEA